jgi:hypothetical protein
MVVLHPPPGGLACASSATTAASRRSFTSSITAQQIPLFLASGNGPNDRLPGKSELLFRPPSWLRRAFPFPHINLPVTGTAPRIDPVGRQNQFPAHFFPSAPVSALPTWFLHLSTSSLFLQTFFHEYTPCISID